MSARAAMLEDALAHATLAESLAGTTGEDEAVVQGLRAIHLAIAALATDEPEPGTPEQWARVELFGHTVTAGLIREKRFAGRTFIEIIRPRTEHDQRRTSDEEPDIVPHPEERRLLHPNAVYAITPLDEETVMGWIRGDREDVPF